MWTKIQQTRKSTIKISIGLTAVGECGGFGVIAVTSLLPKKIHTLLKLSMETNRNTLIHQFSAVFNLTSKVLSTHCAWSLHNLIFTVVAFDVYSRLCPYFIFATFLVCSTHFSKIQRTRHSKCIRFLNGIRFCRNFITMACGRACMPFQRYIKLARVMTIVIFSYPIGSWWCMCNVHCNILSIYVYQVRLHTLSTMC